MSQEYFIHFFVNQICGVCNAASFNLGDQYNGVPFLPGFPSFSQCLNNREGFTHIPKAEHKGTYFFQAVTLCSRCRKSKNGFSSTLSCVNTNRGACRYLGSACQMRPRKQEHCPECVFPWRVFLKGTCKWSYMTGEHSAAQSSDLLPCSDEVWISPPSPRPGPACLSRPLLWVRSYFKACRVHTRLLRATCPVLSLSATVTESLNLRMVCVDKK